MKKQTTINPTKKATTIVARLAFASLFVLNFLTSDAQSVARQTEQPLQVKYLGVADSQPMFQVDVDNENGDTYILSIKTEDGMLLYSERLKDKRFSKKIRWNTPESDNTRLVFTLFSDKEKTTQTFEVNSSLREVRDVVVTKLK